jgi:hypothetical protein
LSSSFVGSGGASISIMLGFRVVSLDSTPSVVPEPGMMVIDSVLGIGGLIAKRRFKK